MIKAEVVADSKNEFGNRITTMVVTFPRIILAEFNTHRMFSRNSASSRAIPFNKMVKSVDENPFVPIAWQKDHKGMQGTEYITDKTDLELVINAWVGAKNDAIRRASYLNHGVKEGRDNAVTKQLCNRLLEPFMYHTVIVTATEWENFFALRCPKYSIREDGQGDFFRSRKDILDKYGREEEHLMTELDWLKKNKGQAEIHMMALAEAMWDAYNESQPKQLRAGAWHIPFADHIDETVISTDEFLHTEPFKKYEVPNTILPTIEEIKVMIATVMCARVSYTVVGEDQKPLTCERMVEIHNNLLTANPKHMSPFEHCAKAMEGFSYDGNLVKGGDHGSEWSGNFKGFIQYRKTIPNENITI